MKDFGNTIYTAASVVAATILGIGIADYWFGGHLFSAFLSWVVLAAIPWIIDRASLYVLSRIKSEYHLPVQYSGGIGFPHRTGLSDPRLPIASV